MWLHLATIYLGTSQKMLKDTKFEQKEIHLRVDKNVVFWLYERAKKYGYGSLNKYIIYLLINFKKNKEKENKMKYG